ncbi:adenosine deaminase [Rhodalgimonas zhirmunskyi]|uniref:Adenosine deaminase n=1 Tax=Rhodalgimonas zhirmunskyi TaxID=2964767 RepID=A0AAJ1U884_9RHOB|nr:adenosine deaminase [Rhodoalgimonas zhirmunskyi]MDQ2094754.1 adenosine deaminase [Rhodoalgimonas zhirmunskyi]
MSFRELPKIELHLHLEGAAPPALIRDIAKEKHTDISGAFDERGAYAFKDFPQFLKVYEAATSVLTSPRDYGRLTRAVLENCADQGAIYVESFLSPDFCGGGDVHAWRDYLAEIEEASREAERDTGIIHKGIVTCIRHFGPEAAKPIALCAAETAGDFIRGFGMGGDETVGHAGDYAWAFDCAREAGLEITSHAGEWGGPESIRETLRDLRPTRIGHGVGCFRDHALIDTLLENDITLEICPGSNVALGLFPSFTAHPIARLRDAGLKITVSTDDPPFFHTSLTREYEELSRAFGWTETDFSEINETALAAAFCDDETKTKLRKKLELP